MLTVLAVAAVFYLVVEPLLVALHEAGHAVVPVARGRHTLVAVGGADGPTIELGLLTVTVQPRGFLAPVTYGATATDAEAGRATVLAATVGGPAVSLVLGLAGGWILFVRGLDGSAAWLAFLAVGYLWFQTLFTLAPLRYPGWAGPYGDYKSDGRIALELLLGRDPAVDEPR